MRRLVPAVIALTVAGCGGAAKTNPVSDPKAPPVLGSPATRETAVQELGFPGFATKNTTRVGGADAEVDAAGAARAVFPAVDADTRPQAVVLVDVDDWRSAISAGQLMAAPLKAPVLFSKDGKLSDVTRRALEELKPKGAPQAQNAQVIRVGAAAAEVDGFRTFDVRGTDYAELARQIDRLRTSTRSGKASQSVVIAPADRPAFAMPAAAYAAKAGVPVLWAHADGLPDATAQALREHKHPLIYVLGPPTAISDGVLDELRKLGTVHRVSGRDPVSNAIAFARFNDGHFGWNVVDPGHGVVFASAERPADAAAGAVLSGSGTYGPLLLVQDAQALPAALQNYLLDIQPGYDKDPVRGVYNHGWLLGDAEAISIPVQARIDTLLEIQPVDASG